MNNTWIDFKELRSKLRFADVLDLYGVRLKVRGERGTGFCPLPTHQGKQRSPSFSVHLGRGIFQCFGGACHAKGNVIDFACLMEGLDPDSGQDIRKAALLLSERLLGGHADNQVKPRESFRKQRHSREVVLQDAIPRDAGSGEAHKNAERGATRPALVNVPLDFELKGLESDHPYLKERGFTTETIAHFGLGYCARGLMQGRIAIPLHDAHGKLVGYAGRLVDDAQVGEDNPKYRFPGPREKDGNSHEFRKSLFLYNGFAVARPVADLVVVEGFPSVWWLWQAGVANVVALMGSDFGREQVKLILRLVVPDGRVWVFTDGDKAGRRCARRLLVRLAPYRFSRWVKLGDGEQPTDLSPDDLSDLLKSRVVATV